jgi:hypothetical protein
MEEIEGWRSDPGMTSVTAYKRRFALLPVSCSDSSSVWLKAYYTKYIIWGANNDDNLNSGNGHIDKIEDITEAEYLVRKLIDGV